MRSEGGEDAVDRSVLMLPILRLAWSGYSGIDPMLQEYRQHVARSIDMQKKKPSTQIKSESLMEGYVERVRKAMTLTDAEAAAPRSAYIAALEQIGSDIECMIDAAKEDDARESRA